MARYFLGLTGTLAIIALTNPSLVILGLLLFILPGMILTVAPTVFVYFGSFYFLSNLFIKQDIRRPRILAFAIVFAAGFSIPLLIDSAVWLRYYEIRNNTVPLRYDRGGYKTLAIFGEKDTTLGNGDLNSALCGPVCQKLLYNGAVETVLVGDAAAPYGDLDENMPVAVFRLQQANRCEDIGITSRENQSLTLMSTSSRMARGECIVKQESKLSEADAILLIDHIDNFNKEKLIRWKINQNRLATIKIELRKKIGKTYGPTSRYISVRAWPLSVPVTVGPILLFGVSWHAYSGFYRYELELCTTPPCGTGSSTDSILNVIFGDYLAEPPPPSKPQPLLSKDLNKPDNSLIELTNSLKYLIDDYYYGRKKKIIPEDMELILNRLKDKRITGVYTNFEGVLRASRKNEISQAVMDRIIEDPYAQDSNDFLESLLAAKSVPRPTNDQLARLNENLDKKKQIYEFFLKRTREPGSRITASHMISEWNLYSGVHEDPRNKPTTSKNLSQKPETKPSEQSTSSQILSNNFEHIVKDYLYERKETISAEEEEMIVRALRDKRVTGAFSQFEGVLRIVLKDISQVTRDNPHPSRIPDAVMDRISEDPTSQDAKDLVNSLIATGINLTPTKNQRSKLHQYPFKKKGLHEFLEQRLKEEPEKTKKSMIRRMIKKWQLA